MIDDHITRPIPIRILILDDHMLMRQGLRLILEFGCQSLREQLANDPQSRMLEDCGDFIIIGDTCQRIKALELAAQYKPNIVLLELNLDNERDLSIITDLLEAAPEAKIILVTAIEDLIIHKQAIQAGVMGIISKKSNPSELIKAIHKVNSGEAWINRNLIADVLLRFHQTKTTDIHDQRDGFIDQLTEREQEIIQLISSGLKNQEIADQLSLSEVTVRHNLTQLYKKLNLKNRVQLLAFAYENNLLDL